MTGKHIHNIEEKSIPLHLQNHEYIHLVHHWLDELFKLSEPEQIGNYEESMLASFPLLLSIALFTNVHLQNHEYIHLVHHWLDELFKLSEPEQIGNYEESMLASFPLLLSIALFTNDRMQNQSFNKRKEMLTIRMNKLKHINWSPTNSIWKDFNGAIKGRPKMFYLNGDKKNIEKMVRWMYLMGGEKDVKTKK